MSGTQLAKLKPTLTLMEHQRTAARDLSRRSSWLLGDVMGLGKTITALTVTATAFHFGETDRVLIVTPMSLKENWSDELIDKTEFTHHVLNGTKPQRKAQLEEFAKGGADILIVNYEQVVAHLDELNALEFGIVIYDEAHYFKSHKAKRTKAVFKLVAGRHFLLTGSPIMNQVNDLWALLHRIDPQEFGSYWSFVNRYAVYGGYMDKQIVGVKNEAELRERLRKYMVRRGKDEIDLPPKLPVNYIKVTALPEQAKLIKQATEELKLDAPALMDPMEVENAMVRVLRVRQICGTTAAIPGHDDHSAKLDKCEEMVEELTGNGEPVVIFTIFREEQACIQRRLEAKGHRCHVLNGDVPGDQRIPTVKAWSKRCIEGSPDIMISTIGVGGVGLNMVEANHAIFLDRDYSPKLNEQCEDRLHRIGQEHPVSIHVIQIRGSVEQRVERIIARKTDIFDSIVEEDNTAWKRKLLEALANDDLDDEDPT